ncbi:MAG: hypothetical protein E3J72_21960 [Planctomycetota bacterium]|nr:MAG: hypothetical protein E3J72_21960 [Planctomycetota bacterium]
MFGFQELKPKITITPASVECPVKACKNTVERQRRSFKREERFFCQDHRIYISPSTFEYDQETENLLWMNKADLSLFRAIKTVKRESRIARDNSEDALSWNVFRYLETENLLSKLLSSITGIEQQQTKLIYWSFSQDHQGSWPELNSARQEFGEELKRSSEPDLVAVTDKDIFFIEAKFTASNNTTPSDKNNCRKYLTGGTEWHKQVFTQDFNTIAVIGKKYELFRFWLLGSWLANQCQKDFYLLNLVLAEREKNIEKQFSPYIKPAVNRQFKRVTWEDIKDHIINNAPEGEEKSKILAYFTNKTMGYDHSGSLQKAFAFK